MTVLKRLRVSNNESIRKLGEATGIAHSVISLIENGKQKMNVEQAKILSNHFNVSLQYILGEDADASKDFNQLLEEAFHLGTKSIKLDQTNSSDVAKTIAITELLDTLLHENPSLEDIQLVTVLFKAIISRKS
jgi:transcriptional regulator with XRE-family HTH domain